MKLVADVIHSSLEPVHIGSCILLIKPEFAPRLMARLENRPGVEVCETEDRSKLLLIIEAKNTNELRHCMDEFEQLAGVISVTLVYHHAENEAALREAL